MLTVAVAVLAAVAAAAGAGIVAPTILGRSLAVFELAIVALAFGMAAWALAASYRRRERRRMLEMRDSALW